MSRVLIIHDMRGNEMGIALVDNAERVSLHFHDGIVRKGREMKLFANWKQFVENCKFYDFKFSEVWKDDRYGKDIKERA